MAEVESLATAMEEMMRTNLYMAPECCIFKTPEILSRRNEKAYVPDSFAIGPFHHGTKPTLIATEKIKLKYLRGILGRSVRPEEKLRELLKAVSEDEERARKCYAGSVDFGVEKFVQMLVLDGCFLIELFRKDAGVAQKEPDDPIFTMSCLLQNLIHDLILLENQTPWFVLQKLFDLTNIQDNSVPQDNTKLDHLAIKFFGNIFTSKTPSIGPRQWTRIRSVESKHILDLLRNFLILTSQLDTGDENSGWQPFPSATTLKEAGIKFFNVNATSILDVQFKNGCLEVPSLLVQETTETIFRNLVSFEQCTPNCTPRITSYVKLMVNLIDTANDMQILSKKGIVDNWLSLEEATQTFNQLYSDAYLKQFYYNGLCNSVNQFCQQRFPKWRYKLMHDYFSNPWAIVGVVVGGLILFFTFIQTICSVVQTICSVIQTWFTKN